MHDEGDLGRLRAAMDVLNRRLATVLHERARLVRVIGAWKRERNLPPLDPEREEAMLGGVLRDAPPDGFAPADLRVIFEAVFAASRRLVLPTK